MHSRQWLLGCQIRPWLLAWGAETLAARLPEVMAQVAEIGFNGFEARLDCLPLDDPALFAEASARANGLALCGAHTGGKWWTQEGAEKISFLAKQVPKLDALGCRWLVVSGGGPADATREEIDRLADTLGGLGRACRDAGKVRVAFHNHAVEIAHDARVLRAIVERCDSEEVMLAPDLGWVARAGMDVSGFIRRFGSRIAYVHVRDVAATREDAELLDVGQGVLDYHDILNTLDETGHTEWVVAESESLDDPKATALSQFRGLQDALSGGTNGSVTKRAD